MNDIMVLDFLKRLATGMAVMFGKNCEIVIHDMNHKDTPIVYIMNGQVSGRKNNEKKNVLGGRDIEKFFDGIDIVNCKTSIGQKNLKSSTFHFKTERCHYAFGINYNYDNLSFVKAVIEDLLCVGEDIDEVIKNTFGSDHVLDDLFEDALRALNKPISAMNKADRIQIIRILDSKGAFTLKKSIPTISQKLGISRCTIYNYLRQMQAEEI